MFKSKGAVYILIPLNIFIWGFFIYRFYTAYTDGDVQIEDTNVKAIKLDELKDSIAYKLNLNYKDPFLKEGEKNTSHHQSHSNNSTNAIRTNTVIKTPSLAVIKSPNDIKYLGLVKNNSTGVSTALVSINGKSHLVKKGDVIDGISVKNISNDVIELKEGKNSIRVNKD